MCRSAGSSATSSRRVLGQFDVFLPPDDDGADLLRRPQPRRRRAVVRAAAARLPHVGRDPRGDASGAVLVGAVAPRRAHRGMVDALPARPCRSSRRRSLEQLGKRGRGAAARRAGRRSGRHPAAAHARAATPVRTHAGDDVAAGGPRLLRDEPGGRRRRRRSPAASAALARRRAVGGWEKRVQRAIGFDQKVAQYDAGERFVRQVVDRVGMSGVQPRLGGAREPPAARRDRRPRSLDRPRRGVAPWRRRPPAVARVLERVTQTVASHDMFEPGRPRPRVGFRRCPTRVCLLETLVRLRRLFRIRPRRVPSRSRTATRLRGRTPPTCAGAPPRTGSPATCVAPLDAADAGRLGRAMGSRGAPGGRERGSPRRDRRGRHGARAHDGRPGRDRAAGAGARLGARRARRYRAGRGRRCVRPLLDVASRGDRGGVPRAAAAPAGRPDERRHRLPPQRDPARRAADACRARPDATWCRRSRERRSSCVPTRRLLDELAIGLGGDRGRASTDAGPCASTPPR